MAAEKLGDRIHQAVLAAGESVSGATAYLVSTDYDAGEVLDRDTVPVLSGCDVEALGSRLQAAEKALLVKTLRAWDVDIG